MKEAYQELSTTGLSTDISAECDFHANAVQTVENVKSAEDTKEWDCFLSHSWGKGQLDHEKVVAIGKQLQAAGVRVWMDEEKITDNFPKQMVEGIDGSHVFIAFVTKTYLDACNNENSNAGQEFNYAAGKDVKMIVPVVLDKSLLDPRTWNGTVLKLRLATKLYIDFSSPVKIKDNFASLIKRIKELKALSFQD